MRLAANALLFGICISVVSSVAEAQQHLDCALSRTTYARNGKVLSAKTLSRTSVPFTKEGQSFTATADLTAEGVSGSITLDIATLAPGATPIMNENGFLELPKLGILTEAHSAHETTNGSSRDAQLSIRVRRTVYEIGCDVE